MLKILLLSPWLPWPPHDGARIRILETLRFLSQRHKVTLLAHVSSHEELAHVEAIREFCENIEVEMLSTAPLPRMLRLGVGLLSGYPIIQSIHFSRRLANRLATITAREHFDIIQVELSMVARYARAISPASTARTVLATHNIETQRFEREIPLSPWGLRRMALVINSLLFPSWEQKSMALYDGAVAVSEHDRDWAQEYLPPGCVSLVPNGVDTRFFHPDRPDGLSRSMVFTGVMDYPPNVDAVVWFVNEIFPRLRARHPDLEFDIVGAKPSAAVLALAAHEGVTVTGSVPDIRPFVDRAFAFVVPLRSGGGTRLKILQAMAMGCPVVSTRLGAEGIDVTHGENLLFADDAPQFLEQIGKLSASVELGHNIGRAGRELVTSQYDWQSCLEGLEDLYRKLLGDTGS